MKNLAKVPMGTLYTQKHNHVTPEGEMFQSAYIGSGLADNDKKMARAIKACIVVSLAIIALALSILI